jgi:dienelactone hydrolase
MDSKLGAYEASPSGAAKGAVVVIQEIFGVNSHIRSVVDGYAEAGFYAIAPAIFDRLERDVQLGYTEDDMTAGIELAFQKLDMSQTLADLQATIDSCCESRKSRRRGLLLWWPADVAVELQSESGLGGVRLLRWRYPR